MAKREFVQLAHHYNAAKHGIGGWWMSEKLDGQRAIWDGGISRGLRVADVPYANTIKDKKDFIATGLWSRRGKVILAPKWWLDALPNIPLDGELYIGRNKFQATESICRRHAADAEWKAVRYMAFDTPPIETWLADGEVAYAHDQSKRFKGFVDWAKARGAYILDPRLGYTSRLKLIRAIIKEGNDVARVHEQIELPYKTSTAEQVMREFMEKICDEGGEGVCLKNPGQPWLAERCYSILKHKPWHDAEATVIGYTWGRETDKGSKLLGLMGAMILQIKDGTFKCSGFTDEERKMTYVDSGESAFDEGCLHPDEEVSGDIHNPTFPRGSQITYKYRELTDANIPKEARYHRPAPRD